MNLLLLKRKSHKPENEDVKEFMRIAELVKAFLESPVSIDKIDSALETMRLRAIARATGFIFAAKHLKHFTATDENILAKLFSDSMKKNESKQYYSEDLLGVDPSLRSSVQKAFFSIIRSLMHEIIACADLQHNSQTYSYVLTCLEALTCHVQAVDTHMLLDLPLSGTIKVLLDWSKGRMQELDEADPETKKKTAKLRQDLSTNSWKLYKLLLLTVIGSWQGSNATQQQQVQEHSCR